MKRLMQFWLARSQEERREYSALFALCFIYVVHYLVFCIPQPFFIEDAGISFAFAQNFVDGEGFVAYAGGERVEGFSNPLWTFLVAIFYALGLSVWTSSKLLGALFGVMTLPLSFAIVKRANISKNFAFLAPFALALSPNFVIWNASGLENSLYCFLLALGMWRLLLESEEPNRHPLSALVFCLVAMTRPEGIMYVAVAGFSKLIFAIVDRKYKSFFYWALVFVVPFGLYQTWRYQYFAWSFPNTYYAKLGTGKRFKPFSWTQRGWKYINAYLEAHNIVDWNGFKIHMGYALPLLLLGMNGFKKSWMRWTIAASMCWLLVVVLWDGKIENAPEFWESIEKNWIKIRVLSLLGISVGVGISSLFREGWRARSLLWAMGASSIFFVIYSGGDWMKAHRWFNIVAIFLLPVLVIGLAEFLSVFSLKKLVSIPKSGKSVSLQTIIVSLVVVGYCVSEIKVSTKFALNPETSVTDIHRRVRYMTWVQRRLDIDHVTLLDVDMGAHMIYSGWGIVDTAGLVDVSVARHSDYNRKFIKEYVFKERKPEFAHCHGGWAKTSKIPRNSEWKSDYIEISGYPIGNRRLHIGNHIRKDLFISQIEQDDFKNAVVFDGGIRLLQWSVPAPEVANGGALFVETKWQSFSSREADVLVLIGLERNGKIESTASFQPGYRWYNMESWKKREAVSGKFPMPISTDLAEGEYSVYIAILDQETGENLGSETKLKEISGINWLSLGQKMEILSKNSVQEKADEDRELALQTAEDGDCELAWSYWKNSTRHLYRNRHWERKHLDEQHAAIASCNVQKAEQEENKLDQIDLLLEAKKWDHNLESYQEMAYPLAEIWHEKGEELFGLEDWQGAYDAFSRSVALEPSRSHTRKWAEESRDKRLKITPPYKKKDKKKKPSRLQ